MDAEIRRFQWEQFVRSYSDVHRGRICALRAVAPSGEVHLVARGRMLSLELDRDTVVLTLESAGQVTTQRLVITALYAEGEGLMFSLRAGGTMLLEL